MLNVNKKLRAMTKEHDCCKRKMETLKKENAVIKDDYCSLSRDYEEEKSNAQTAALKIHRLERENKRLRQDRRNNLTLITPDDKSIRNDRVGTQEEEISIVNCVSVTTPQQQPEHPRNGDSEAPPTSEAPDIRKSPRIKKQRVDRNTMSNLGNYKF